MSQPSDTTTTTALVVLSPGAKWTLAAVLIGYCIVLLVVSLRARRRVATEEDFLVAGRRLPLLMSWATLVATWFGATITSNADYARADGLPGVILDPFANSLTLVLAGFLFARPLWRMKLTTMGDFYRRQFGVGSELTACAILCPSYFFWIGANYVALGELLQVFFGLPMAGAIFLGAGVALCYTLIGGMWSVTMTDLVQVAVAFFGLSALVMALLAAIGADGSMVAGIQRVWSETPAERLSLLPSSGVAAIGSWVALWATGLFGNHPGQDLQQRVFAARDERTALWTCILGGITYFVLGMIPVVIGLASNVSDPDLFAGIPGDEHQRGVLHHMAGKYLSTPLLMIYALAYLSIVMSCAVTVVLSPATMLAHNLLGRVRFFRRAGGLMLDRVCVVLMAGGSVLMALGGRSIIDLLTDQLSVMLVALFIPMLMGVYGTPKGDRSGMAAMLLGTGCWFVRWGLEGWGMPESWPGQPDHAEYADYVAFAYPAQVYGASVHGVLVGMACIPAVGYGLAGSLVGYGCGQRWPGARCSKPSPGEPGMSASTGDAVE